MSDITSHQNMGEHLKNVTELIKEAEYIKNDNNKALDFFKKIRIVHGCAIYDNAKEKDILIHKNEKKLTDEELIKISISDSILHCIHNHVRNYDRFITKITSDTNTNIENNDSSFSNAIKNSKAASNMNMTNAAMAMAMTNSKSNSMSNSMLNSNKVNLINTRMKGSLVPSKSNPQKEELFIENITTENPDSYTNNLSNLSNLNNSNNSNNSKPDFSVFEGEEINVSELPSDDLGQLLEMDESKKLKQSTQFIQSNQPKSNQFNILDQSNNASNFASKVKQEINNLIDQGKGLLTGGNDNDIHKPTIVNYWSNTCMPSIKFRPEWEKFKESARVNLPNLQVEDVETSTNEARQVAKNAGITQYPTVKLYYNGKTYEYNGQRTVDALTRFVKSIV